MELASSAWVHPYTTLEEITQFAAAFLDLLRLASGLQSSASPFTWPPSSLHKALAWARHLEQALGDRQAFAGDENLRALLCCSLQGLGFSEQGLATELHQLGSQRRVFDKEILNRSYNVSHPAGVMADFPASGEGLESRRALDDALVNLIASAPTYPAGLPCLTASDLSSARRLFLQALLQAVSPDSDYFESITDCLIRLEGESALVKDEISARNSALRCAESLKQFVESTAGCLVSEEKQITCVTTFWDRSNSAVEMADENLFEAWARNALEYVTSFTTVYKSAAANLIFKSSEDDWRRVLDTSRAYTSSTMVGDSVGNETEIAELCCLQLAYSDCRDLAFRIAASPINTATDFCDTGNRSGGWPMPEGSASVETFLKEFLENQVDLWWKLPPVLLAGVCGSRFSMLKTYLQNLMKVADVHGRSCKCSCHVSSKTCHTCQHCPNALVERLWCFAVHHPELRTFEARQVDSACKYILDQAQKKLVS